MVWLLYNLLFLLVYPLLLPHFLWRMKRRGGYRRHFGQRLGRFDPTETRALGQGGWIWVHAVSVGEIGVALNFIRVWRARDPQARFVLSHTTSTGRQVAEKGVTDRDFLLYVPVDLPWVTRRVVRLIQPRLFVLTESEFWPNLLRAMRGAGVPVALMNGRVSDRSFPRYQRFAWLTRAVLPLIDRFCMQSTRDAERITALGAPADRVRVMNSAKYDLPPPAEGREASTRAVLAAAGFPPDAVLLMGGSTWPGEERVLADMLPRLRRVEPGLRLVLAPRHFERAQEVLRELTALGVTLATRAPVDGFLPSANPDVFLLNTTGELMTFYAVADLVFVGKTLFEKGGQNFIEPAFLGKPIWVGPHTENFEQVRRDFLQAEALREVPDPHALEASLTEHLRDPGAALAMGARAGELVQRNTGALTRTAAELEALRSVPPPGR